VYHNSDASCDDFTWTTSNLLLFEADVYVMALDPTTRTVRGIASLDDFVLSPDEQWIAGYQSGGPLTTTNVYVVSLRSRLCLVVPHPVRDAVGFTRDSSAVIVSRTGKPGPVQFALSSLPKTCPAGAGGVLPQTS